MRNDNIDDKLLLIVRMLEQNSADNKAEKKEKLSLEDTLDKNTEDLKLEHEDSLEEELDEDSQETTSIKYYFDEEKFLMEQFYNNEQIKYEQSLYKQTISSNFESQEEYIAAENEFSDVEAEILTTEEAEEAMIEIQYAAVIGTMNDISSEKKRKFDMWIKFNPAMFKLFESTYALTRNVDYRPLA